MRVVSEMSHPECRISVFSWNGKYLVKFEQDLLEQTYKIKELDVNGDADIKQMLSEEFIAEVLERFAQMRQSLYKAMDTL
jgi:hypothetical protein